MFQNRNPVRVFLYHCISEGNRLSSENLDLYSNSASCWQRMNLHIYAATNSVCGKHDYGINKLNCLYNSFTAIHVIMLELKNNKRNTYYRCTYLYIVNAVIFKRLLTSYLKRDLVKKINK